MGHTVCAMAEHGKRKDVSHFNTTIYQIPDAVTWPNNTEADVASFHGGKRAEGQKAGYGVSARGGTVYVCDSRTVDQEITYISTSSITSTQNL